MESVSACEEPARRAADLDVGKDNGKLGVLEKYEQNDREIETWRAHHKVKFSMGREICNA